MHLDSPTIILGLVAGLPVDLTGLGAGSTPIPSLGPHPASTVGPELLPLLMTRGAGSPRHLRRGAADPGAAERLALAVPSSPLSAGATVEPLYEPLTATTRPTSGAVPGAIPAAVTAPIHPTPEQGGASPPLTPPPAGRLDPWRARRLPPGRPKARVGDQADRASRPSAACPRARARPADGGERMLTNVDAKQPAPSLREGTS